MHRPTSILLPRILLSTSLLLIGCKSSDTRTIDVDQVLVPRPIEGLRDYSSPSDGSKVREIIMSEMDFLEQNEVSFFSKATTHNGIKHFKVVSLKRDETVVIGDFGQTNSRHEGTYKISTNGEIILKLNNYSGTWPVMRYILTDSIGGALYPAKGFSKDVDAGWELDYSHDYTSTSWFFKCLFHSEDAKLVKFIPPSNDLIFPPNKDEASFRLEVGIYTNGHPEDISYVATDIGEWSYEEGDWHLEFVEEMMSTASKWEYTPMIWGNSIQPYGEDYDCSVLKETNGVRWIIREDVGDLLIYDSATQK